MSIQNNTAVDVYQNFVLPTALDSDFSSEDLADDMEGLQLTMQRVKIPGGGNLQFEIRSDDPDNPDYERKLVGVILYHHLANAYWPEGSEYDDNVPPFCQSFDGKQGYGEPGGVCAACAFNQFGSTANGSGKACKNMRQIYLLRSGEYLPLQISLPPTSLRPFNDFMNLAFVARRRPSYSAIVEIGLKRAESGGYTYSVATFRKVRDLEGKVLRPLKATQQISKSRSNRFWHSVWRTTSPMWNHSQAQHRWNLPTTATTFPIRASLTANATSCRSKQKQPTKLAPLSKRQMRFAEKNHKLVYAFLQEQRYDPGEYYDLAVMGYLRAVERYCSHAYLRRFSFSTVAYRAMQQSIVSWKRGESRRRQAEEAYSALCGRRRPSVTRSFRKHFSFRSCKMRNTAAGCVCAAASAWVQHCGDRRTVQSRPAACAPDAQSLYSAYLRFRGDGKEAKK